ncbi:hypothetical protein NQ314_011099 [Rhamnusium bicolor]|uniref:DUF1977 domain-containing protein n=1 Tax=Rhamnusium bicolor TaxID=1586634 RepID=A0AAV8XLX1_9CUCU|nr:hypothetical protein NQ314_011099 [Rhamnusium bicolor]
MCFLNFQKYINNLHSYVLVSATKWIHSIHPDTSHIACHIVVNGIDFFHFRPSLQSTSKFVRNILFCEKTQNLNVPYYVKENFHTEYQGSVRRLELSVEEEYISNLRHACYREKNYRDSMIWKARNFGDRELFQTAQNIKMPSCEQLQNLRNHG